MKYKKHAGGLKFEIWNWGGLKTFETGQELLKTTG